MPIVINEFEVVAEPEPPPQKAAEPRPAPPLRPADVERIVRRFEERRARLHAD